MKRWLLSFFVLAVGIPAFADDKSTSASLADLLADVSKHRHYKPVGRHELKQAESLFVRTLSRAESYSEIAKEWRDLGWRFEKSTSYRSEAREVWTLREAPDAIRGRGFFAFDGGTNPIYLQAPHSFFDKHTRRITLRLFEQGGVGAAAWNTVRRSVLDAAHSPDTYINAFTRAILQTNSQHAIVQLHGFDASKRSTFAGRKSQVIVSNGTLFPGRIAREISRKLSKTVEESVNLYPSQVEELGGTKNSQARIVHQHGWDSFVHSELAADFRQKLRDNEDFRDRFHASLTSSLSAFFDEPSK